MPAPAADPSPVTAVTGLTVRWAAHRAGGSPQDLELTICVRDGAWSASARIADRPAPLLDLRRCDAAWTTGPDDLEHVDAPGLAAITFRRRATGVVDVLYARSCLPGLLGLPGGRCELLGAEAADNHAPD